MATHMVPSDSYARHLALPSLPPAPDHVRNLLPGYEITHILGSGGFATVYKAIGKSGKEVALKIPRTDDVLATIDMSIVDKFKLESDIWNKLNHSNIVKFHSSNTVPIPPYFHGIDGRRFNGIINKGSSTDNW